MRNPPGARVASLTALGLVSLLFTAAEPAAAQPAPLVGHYLPGPGGSTSAANDVSEDGTVGGWVAASGGTRRPALWRGSRLVRLPVPAAAVPGAAAVDAWVTRVEGPGAIGNATEAPRSGTREPGTLRWRNGTGSAIDTTDPVVLAQDLNRAGDVLITAAPIILGSAPSRLQRADGTLHETGIQGEALAGDGRVFGWRNVGDVPISFRSEAVHTDGATTTTLDAPADRSAKAHDAADDGTACGEFFVWGAVQIPKPYPAHLERRPVLWQPDGSRVNLPLLGTESWCARTAGQDVAAGQYIRSDGEWGTVLWLRGTAHPIGPDDPSVVTAVNGRGQVLGFAYGADGVRYPFVADTRGWRRLAAPGGGEVMAQDINRAGVVVGTTTGDGTTSPSTSRAIRWFVPPPRG